MISIFNKLKIRRWISEFYSSSDSAIRAQSALGTLETIKRFMSRGLSDEPDVKSAFWREVVSAAIENGSDRQKMGRLASLWGVTPILTLSLCAKADRRCGVRAESLVFTTYYISSEFDHNLSDLQAFICAQHPELFVLFRRMVFAWALLTYDIFHLYNDRGILEPAGGYGSDRFGIALPELKLYRQARKTLFTYAYGADHRMRQKTLALAPLNFCMECPEPGKFCICDDEGAMQMLATTSSYATAMLGFGLSMDLIPKARWMSYLVVDTDVLTPVARNPGDVLRIGHFPNHGHFKGTKYLEEAVAKLRAVGKPIELVYLTGVSNARILSAMAEVDVVVDQLISGAFGLTAVEAMALGRPVIAHLRPGVQIADPDNCPIIKAMPTTIVEVLERLIEAPQQLDRVGELGRKYVETYHSVHSMSESLAALYKIYIKSTAVVHRRNERKPTNSF